MDRKLEERRKGYKKAVDSAEARRKREDLNVQLRKQKREENLLQKRRLASGGVDPSLACSNEQATDARGVSVSRIPEFIAGVKSADPAARLEATQAFRKLLSIETTPPIQEVVDSGVIPYFVEFLKGCDHPALQFEAAWALTNVASGTPEQTREVIQAGSIPIFVQLLSSPSDDVREQAVWALGNIAGDSPQCRDFVLQAGGLAPLLHQLRESEKFPMMRNATWTLSNLCRGKPQPPFEWVSPALATLANLIYNQDCEVLTDACWALSYLSDGADSCIEAVIQSGVCRRLVDLLVHTSPLVQTPALRTVGNIVTGDDRQTQVILQCNALPNLLTLLSSPKKGIRKEACWTISNITAGNNEQIQEVFAQGIIPLLIEILNTGDFDVKKEAAWAISNASSGGTSAQIDFLVSCGCIKPLCDLLPSSDTKIVSVALEALENILRSGKQKQVEGRLHDNPYCALIEQAEGLTKIEALQDDQNEEVYQKAVKILGNYFPLEDDDGDESQPQDQPSQLPGGFGAAPPQGGFNFGA